MRCVDFFWFLHISHVNAYIKGDEARLDGLLSGADDYISKPFTAKQLLGRTYLQMQIGRRKVQLEAKFEARSHELRVRQSTWSIILWP
jgi:DNA-binding response OmpR family regulator